MAYRYPDTHVLYRKLTKTFPKIVRGEGCYLFGEDGTRYLDASGGAYVANCGHGVREIVSAVTDQIGEVAYITGMSFTNDAVETLANELAEVRVGDLDKFSFLSSGSDATEAALKLARQYWVERGKPKKHKIVALAPGYHGNTMLALAASSRDHYKIYFREWMVPVRYVPAPYPYRCDCRGGPCPRCDGTALDQALTEEGSDTVAAFIAEPVGGSSTGASVPRADYWRTIREICDRHEVLWIADEVLTGAGRTGTWSALEPYGAVPDLQVLGKGISGGYAPLAAVAAPERILDVIAAASGSMIHAQTFTNTPMICAAGVAALQYLKRHHLVARCAQMGTVLHQKLGALRGRSIVGDVRGRGLLAGIELVADQRTTAPFARREKVAERLTDAALEAGLVVWPNVGHADGTNGDAVMVAPPFVITEAEIDEMVEKLGTAIDRVG
ncbi:MAG: aminotransferase class III-fold pyridoxal phosphate-dependent enzyme [Gemmatimonadota bacterium]